MTSPVRVAVFLAMGTAVSLGLARFSYALMLPPMRADLGWSYFVSGAMNTVNAVGYLIGALLAGRWLARHPARRVLLVNSAATAVTLFAHGLVVEDGPLYLFRLLTGAASAVTLVSGALMAARLATDAQSLPGRKPPASLLLGIYYGGTGIGIVASAIAVPTLVSSLRPHGWQLAWLGIGVLALAATVLLAIGTRGIDAQGTGAGKQRFDAKPFVPALAAYFLFGLGYIGYMTFVITLLREWQVSPTVITAFYLVLGLAVCVSPWLWAWLLQGWRNGTPLAVLNALLAIATVLPVLSAHPVAVFASGLLFGGVFLALVASTTALLRHNLPPAGWSSGIAVFTTIFAAGQIVGPAAVGWVADHLGGLRGGLACSAAVLLLGAIAATRQRALAS